MLSYMLSYCPPYLRAVVSPHSPTSPYPHTPIQPPILESLIPQRLPSYPIPLPRRIQHLTHSAPAPTAHRFTPS